MTAATITVVETSFDSSEISASLTDQININSTVVSTRSGSRIIWVIFNNNEA